jgi:hypothetical protein
MFQAASIPLMTKQHFLTRKGLQLTPQFDDNCLIKSQKICNKDFIFPTGFRSTRNRQSKLLIFITSILKKVNDALSYTFHILYPSGKCLVFGAKWAGFESRLRLFVFAFFYAFIFYEFKNLYYLTQIFFWHQFLDSDSESGFRFWTRIQNMNSGF